MKQPFPPNVTVANQTMLESQNDALRDENTTLKNLLLWALSWVTPTQRGSEQYKRALQVTRAPDPQAWRDQHK